jgi:hypothetical protein
MALPVSPLPLLNDAAGRGRLPSSYTHGYHSIP